MTLAPSEKLARADTGTPTPFGKSSSGLLSICCDLGIHCRDGLIDDGIAHAAHHGSPQSRSLTPSWPSFCAGRSKAAGVSAIRAVFPDLAADAALGGRDDDPLLMNAQPDIR